MSKDAHATSKFAQRDILQRGVVFPVWDHACARGPRIRK